jgi:hypothetical protein
LISIYPTVPYVRLKPRVSRMITQLTQRSAVREDAQHDHPVASAAPQLSAVLAMFSPDMHLYWAEKLPVS